MSDFKTNVDNFIGEYIWRMIQANKIKSDDVLLLIKNLRNQRLTADLIENDLCEELKNLLTLQHIDSHNSDRLNGKGVSKHDIEETLKNSLSLKLEKIVQYFKLFK